MRPPRPGTEIADYEGLVFSTAARLDGRLEMDVDDIRQVLRVKVWTSLRKYDTARSKMSRENYVFMCIQNAVKDMLRKRKRGEVSIEYLTGDAGRLTREGFDALYFREEEEAVYGAIERERVLIPSTLDDREVRVVVLLYDGYSQTEAARALGLTRSQVERAMVAIRDKMADWRPTEGAQELPQPERVLHPPAPRSERPALAQAA